MVDTNSVLGKVVVVLGAFEADDRGLALTTLIDRTGLPKSTVHRLAKDLVDVGLLDHADGRYRLGSALFQLGMKASVERGLLEVATPFLQDLTERTHETVHLAIREGGEVVYVAKLGGHTQARSPSRVGGRMPLAATAIGKALLAHAPGEVQSQVLSSGLARRTPRTITAPGILRRQLDDVLVKGVSFEFEESAVGIACVAAPVLDAGERCVAAVSVTGPVTRFRPGTHANAVRAAAAGIGATLARRAGM